MLLTALLHPHRQPGSPPACVVASPCSYGPNALTPPKKPGFFAKLWAQLNNVLIFILLAAAVVVAGLQEWCVPRMRVSHRTSPHSMLAARPADFCRLAATAAGRCCHCWCCCHCCCFSCCRIEFGLIIGVVTVNVMIGLMQEGKAEKAAEAIKAMLSSSGQQQHSNRQKESRRQQQHPLSWLRHLCGTGPGTALVLKPSAAGTQAHSSGSTAANSAQQFIASQRAC